MKRTKQVQTMVDEVNSVLKDTREIYESNSLFNSMEWLLSKVCCYKGYNWYYEEDYTDVTGKATKIEKLAGTSNKTRLKELDAYIQLY